MVAQEQQEQNVGLTLKSAFGSATKGAQDLWTKAKAKWSEFLGSDFLKNAKEHVTNFGQKVKETAHDTKEKVETFIDERKEQKQQDRIEKAKELLASVGEYPQAESDGVELE